MDTLDDLVARERRSQDIAVRAGGDRDRTYTYHRFCTTAWKTGNFLRHLGVGEGVAVGVAADPLPQPVLSLFGTALLGGRTRFGPPAEWDGRVVVAHADALADYDLPPGGQRVGYGNDPADPAASYFERDVWSENPSFPPVDRDPDAVVLDDGDAEYTHRALLAAARDVVERLDLTADSTVAVRASLSRPGTVVAGVLAPLLAGGTVLFPGAEAVGDVAVGSGDSPEDRIVDPDSAFED